MVESSKILTVSYGTFSCTLEGFDDSFSTMKAIAEYFRDLAAGDRYFGAEPPTPDAEMLTRIAEREISRRVDVRTSDSGFVLRASEPAQQPFADVPQVATTPKAAPAPQTTPAEEPAPAESQSAPVATKEPQAAPDAAGEPAAPPVAEAEPVMPPAPRRPVMTRFAAPDAADIDDADVTSEDAPARRMPLRTEAPAHPDADSVAAKLQRIRAVVGGVSPAAATPFVEDLEESDDIANEDRAMTAPEALQPDDNNALVAAVTGAAQADDADEPAAEAVKPVLEDEPDDVAELDDTPVMSVDFTPEDVEVAADIEDVAVSDTDETDDQINAVLRNLERAGLRSHAPENVDPASETGSPDPADAKAENEVEADAPQGEPRAMPQRARILRVARRSRPAEMPTLSDDAVVPAPEADDKDEPVSPQLSTEVPAIEDEGDTLNEGALPALRDGAGDLSGFDPDAAQSTLSAEDEADLQRELAAVAADVAAVASATDTAPDDVTDDKAEADEATADAEAAENPVRRDTLPGTSEAEMSRIMSQADEELADPEASRRRNAIAHLKAAVAATEAARQLGEPAKDRDATEGAFRDDLQQVVRPRRAALSHAPSERSERPRPAPLKLVASQRVDLAQAADAAHVPVQPRRVSAPVLEDENDASSFAEFAEQMGATSLQDLLEAAAAYTAFVEGVEDFSRPQIMKKVQQTAAEDFSREDGLRSFGTLLRQGRIAKVRNGRFQVSERTRFKPEARAAEG